MSQCGIEPLDGLVEFEHPIAVPEIAERPGSVGGLIRVHSPRGFISDLTVDVSGNILLLDSVNARIFIKTGQATGFKALTESLKAYMRFPANLTTDRTGRIYLVDRNGGKIIILTRDGSYLGRLSAMGWKEGLLNHPSQICINEQGEIFIADTSNNRVH